MAYTLERILGDWLASSHVHWESETDVVVWSRLFGSDVERAWRECPRADYLAAIAGACDAPRDAFADAVYECASEALVFVPQNVATPREVLSFAPKRDAAPTPDAPRTRRLSVLLERAHALVERSVDKAQAAMQSKDKGALGAAQSAAKLIAADVGVDLLGGAPPSAQALAALVAAAHEQAPIRRFAERFVQAHRLRAEAHAMRAASSSGVVASSLDLASAATMLLEADADIDRAEATRLASRSKHRVFTESALALSHAASAFGAAALGDDANQSVLIASAIRSVVQHHDMAERGARVLEAEDERATSDKHARFAERIRARVPFTSLRAPLDEEEKERAIARDPRGALLRSLDAGRLALEVIGDAEALNASEVVRAIVAASGPLDRVRLAPAFATFHSHMRRVFERAAAETEDADERRSFLESAAKAVEAEREVHEALDELGREPPS